MSRASGCLLAAALTLSFAACGGQDKDGGRSAATGPAISKARLITKADAVCRRYDKKLSTKASALKLPSSGAGSGLATVAPFIELKAELAAAEVSEIRMLGVPTKGVNAFNDFLDQRLTVANSLKSAAAAIRGGDLSALEGAAEQFDSNPGQATAKRFGFKDCAKPSPPLLPQG